MPLVFFKICMHYVYWTLKYDTYSNFPHSITCWSVFILLGWRSTSCDLTIGLVQKQYPVEQHVRMTSSLFSGSHYRHNIYIIKFSNSPITIVCAVFLLSSTSSPINKKNSADANSLFGEEEANDQVVRGCNSCCSKTAIKLRKQQLWR